MFDGLSTVLGITPTAGVYTLPQDVYALNMTIDAGVVVVTSGFVVRVAQTLTIIATGFLDNSGQDGNNDTTPGNGGPIGTLLGGGVGGFGGFDDTDGLPGADASFYPSREPTKNGGTGGDADVEVGGAGGTTYPQQGFGTYAIDQMAAGNAVAGGPGGGGGAGAGTTGGNLGGGGGGGGGGGVIVVVAQHLVVPANAIRARGGAGGAGFSVGDGSGNGGGGGGGVGGTIIIVTADSVAPTVDVSGGAGGLGHNAANGTAGDTGAFIAISTVVGPL